jgi:hypothetical protein
MTATTVTPRNAMRKAKNSTPKTGRSTKKKTEATSETVTAHSAFLRPIDRYAYGTCLRIGFHT